MGACIYITILRFKVQIGLYLLQAVTYWSTTQIRKEASEILTYNHNGPKVLLLSCSNSLFNKHHVRTFTPTINHSN